MSDKSDNNRELAFAKEILKYWKIFICFLFTSQYIFSLVTFHRFPGDYFKCKAKCVGII
jgi:hypothetical protein